MTGTDAQKKGEKIKRRKGAPRKNKLMEKETTEQSKVPLTESQESMLTKSLKFIPNQKKIDTAKVLADLNEWERRMRLKEYFHGKADKESMMKMKRF